MPNTYKNFWSLNTDEAVVAGILRQLSPKNIEVLMPMNAQMQDIDLVIMEINSKKAITLQIKGSRAYEPTDSDKAKHGQGNSGWFKLSENHIFKAQADYFIFLTYIIEEDIQSGRRSLKPHIITIPTDKLQTLTKKYKEVSGDNYHYYFWINPSTKKAFDTRDNEYQVAEYLDKKGYIHLKNDLIS